MGNELNSGSDSAAYTYIHAAEWPLKLWPVTVRPANDLQFLLDLRSTNRTRQMDEHPKWNPRSHRRRLDDRRYRRRSARAAPVSSAVVAIRSTISLRVGWILGSGLTASQLRQDLQAIPNMDKVVNGALISNVSSIA